MVKILLDHKADVNKEDKDGYTALMLAIRMNIDNEKDKINQMNIIKVLIDRTVDPQQLYKYLKNKDGQTALDIAMGKKNQSKKIQFIQDNQAIIDLLKGLYA